MISVKLQFPNFLNLQGGIGSVEDQSPDLFFLALSAEVEELVEILQWLKEEESNNLNERK